MRKWELCRDESQCWTEDDCVLASEMSREPWESDRGICAGAGGQSAAASKQCNNSFASRTSINQTACCLLFLFHRFVILVFRIFAFFSFTRYDIYLF